MALRPEGIEVRQGNAAARGLGAVQFVEMAHPSHFIAPFGKPLAHAKTLGKGAENIEVRARLANRWHRLFHGQNITVAPGGTDVIALECGRGRQNDVGKARTRRPPAFIDDKGIGFAKRLDQPVEILMMMKRIAAAPVHQARIGVDPFFAIELITATRIEQHVGDARYRNPGLLRIAPCLMGRVGEPLARRAHAQ